MDNEQILERTIRKAIGRGWLNLPIKKIEGVLVFFGASIKHNIDIKIVWKEKVKNADSEWFVFNNIESVIFDHSFAKAFWGDIEIIEHSYCLKDSVGGSGYPLSSWQYHLQIMVLEKDPIKYLEKFLD